MAQAAIEIHHGISPELADETKVLLDTSTAGARLNTFDDAQRLLLVNHADELIGLTATATTAAGTATGTAASATGRGFAQLHCSGDNWDLALVTDEDPDGQASVGAQLMAAGVDVVAHRGGGHLSIWMRGGHDGLGPALHHLGFGPERTLLQLRCPLPLDPAVVRAAELTADGATADAAAAAATTNGLTLRPFQPGHDEDGWLAVNNAAFDGHPEQGGWDRARLDDREAEPWFDPNGFVVLERGGRLVGSCWTKVHRELVPVMGEIYVISVHPSEAGKGLGTVLAVAGLGWLSGLGIGVGMLYVESDNAPALAVYRRLGFTEHHADVRYGLAVPAG